MATNPEELAPGAEHEDATDPANRPGTEIGKPEDEGADQPSPYDDLARDLGWTPKDQYTGPPENWKSAEQFLRDGRDIQRETSRELKTLRSQMDNISRTTGAIVEQTVRERMAGLTAKYNELVDDGKGAEAFEVAQEISALRSNGTARPTGPSPSAQSFADENASWFKKDPLPTARAIEVTNLLAAQGYDEATQLKAAKETVAREFPHLFGKPNGGKPQAAVHQPGSRGSQRPANEKTFAAMPKAAQDIAVDMEKRGVIKSREDYVKNYFANQEGKA